MFLLILETEEGKEKETSIVRGKHQLVASHTCPNWGSNLQSFGVQDNAPTNYATWPGVRCGL